jgi:hypothetical protein
VKLVAVGLLSAYLILVVAATARASPPSWWVADALCVHSGWHYAETDARHAEYVLWGHGYRRTWKTYGNGEGSWDAANYGYGGGMQMDGGFQSNYGSRYLAQYGPAGSWPVAVQIAVAYKGWLRQGWGAWPNTSTACGLR